jgi:Flp pilus assembly protein CpaB
MNVRVILLVVLAIGVGFGTIKFARQWIDQQQAAIPQAEAQLPQVQVLVARVDMPAGSGPTRTCPRPSSSRASAT